MAVTTFHRNNPVKGPLDQTPPRRSFCNQTMSTDYQHLIEIGSFVIVVFMYLPKSASLVEINARIFDLLGTAF